MNDKKKIAVTILIDEENGTYAWRSDYGYNEELEKQYAEFLRNEAHCKDKTFSTGNAFNLKTIKNVCGCVIDDCIEQIAEIENE